MTTKKVAPKKEEASKKEGADLTVSDIARSLNLNPKIARATLRRAGMSAVGGRCP
jgi:hypothetical protein